MDFKVREVKTKSGKVAVQVYTLTNRKRNILKHLGSGSNESEIQDLKDRPKNVNHGFDGFDPLPESDIPVHAVIARLKNLSPKKEKTRKVKEDNEVHLD